MINLLVSSNLFVNLRPSNEALRKAAQEWEKNTGGLPYGGLLSGTNVNIGSIIDQLKGKFSS
jgi:hypothetical protein